MLTTILYTIMCVSSLRAPIIATSCHAWEATPHSTHPARRYMHIKRGKKARKLSSETIFWLRISMQPT